MTELLVCAKGMVEVNCLLDSSSIYDRSKTEDRMHSAQVSRSASSAQTRDAFRMPAQNFSGWWN